MKRLTSVLPPKVFFIAAAVLFMILSGTGLPLFKNGNRSFAASGDAVIATVNKKTIKQSKFDQVIQEYKKKSGKETLTTDERKRLIHNIIIRHLILEQSSVQAVRHDEAFIKKVEAFEKEMLIKFFLEKEIGSKLMATDEEILKFYQHNQEKFKSPKRISARVILLRKQDEAKTVLAKLKNGEDFASLVKEHSVDLPSAVNEGIMEIEKGKVYPQIEKTVFSLKENEISDIVETQYGYNIFKVEKIVPPQTKPYATVKDNIKKLILRQKEAKAFFEMASRLEKNAEIKIFDKSLAE